MGRMTGLDERQVQTSMSGVCAAAPFSAARRRRLAGRPLLCESEQGKRQERAALWEEGTKSARRPQDRRRSNIGLDLVDDGTNGPQFQNALP